MARMKLASSSSLFRSTGWIQEPDEEIYVPMKERNHEALVLVDAYIEHCVRDNRQNPPKWGNGIVIPDGVTAAPSVLQRPPVSEELARNFDALIPRGQELWHYACYNGDRPNWRPLKVVSPRAAGTASLVSGINLNESSESFPDLHAVVLESDDPRSELKEVWYYRLELTGRDTKLAKEHVGKSPDELAEIDAKKFVWQPITRITTKATGSPAAIISGDMNNGSIEVLIPEGRDLVHYSMPSIDFSIFGFPPIGISPFLRKGVVMSNCEGPAAFVELESSYFNELNGVMGTFADGLSARPDFHALVPEAGGLRHYWKPNYATMMPWLPGAIVAPVVSGPATMIENIYGQTKEVKIEIGYEDLRKEYVTKNGNLEVLLTIGDDLYFMECEFVSFYEFKWYPPVMII